MAVHSDPSERALVARARRGDHGAFESLLDARLPSTFRAVLAILGDESDARDATQAIFVQAWRNLPGLRDEQLFPAWFGRIVVNTAR
jgi:RNA polymerase sigma-70 factor (ECF subfamily)